MYRQINSFCPSQIEVIAWWVAQVPPRDSRFGWKLSKLGDWLRYRTSEDHGNFTNNLDAGGHEVVSSMKGEVEHRLFEFEAARCQSIIRHRVQYHHRDTQNQRCSQAGVPRIRHSHSPGALSASSLLLVAFVWIPSFARTVLFSSSRV